MTTYKNAPGTCAGHFDPCNCEITEYLRAEVRFGPRYNDVARGRWPLKKQDELKERKGKIIIDLDLLPSREELEAKKVMVLRERILTVEELEELRATEKEND